MILYSIIIPHKNIPRLLERCLDSIPQRDDLQIIIVDDDSSESIVDFNNFPGLNMKNTEVVFTKEGRGAGYARNVGLPRAAGKWILFADADDFFTYCFDEVLDEYADCSADMVYFGFNRLDSGDYQAVGGGPEDYNKLVKDMDGRNIPNPHVFCPTCVPWAKIIRKELVEKHALRYDEVPILNDAMFNARADAFSRNIAFDKRAIYCYTLRADSLGNSGKNYDWMVIRTHVLGRCSRFLRQYNYRDWNKIRWDFISILQRESRGHYKKAIEALLTTGFPAKEIRLYKILFEIKSAVKVVLENLCPPILYKIIKLIYHFKKNHVRF